MQTPTSDLRNLADPEDLMQLEAAFQNLPPGETMDFQTSEAPRKLVRRFLESHWGQFDWALLREGNQDYLARITKRASPGPASLVEMMSLDHRRCDDLFAQAESAAQKGDLAEALELQRQFALGMEHHFMMEEEGFFSEFDQRMGSTGGGPVAVMREEHQQIRGMLARMSAALENADAEDYLGAADTMLYLMEQHNMKEEQMLYPMADDVFGADGEELLKRMFLL